MTQTVNKYKGLSLILAFILVAVLVYTGLDDGKQVADPSIKDREEENRRLVDSLTRLSDELARIVEEQRRKEEESFNRFKKETERLKKEYDERVRDLNHLSDDEHVRLLSEELSKED